MTDGAKLDANESPSAPTEALTRELSALIAGSNRYPPGEANALPEAVARRMSLIPEQVVAGPGSAALVQAILLHQREGGGRVHVSDPSYDGYAKLAGQLGMPVARTPLRDYHHDLRRIAAQLSAGEPATVFLSNPNNPTGSYVPVQELRRFVETVPPDALVVIDEAYVDYASKELGDGFALVAEHEHVVVLRTLSKAYGLAGLRVAYGAASPSVAAEIRAHVLAYSVTRLAETAACLGLSSGIDVGHRASTVQLRRRMVGELRSMGYAVLDSESNFVWLPLGAHTEEFTRACRAHRVLVKPFPGVGVRVSVGAEPEVSLFLSVAARFGEDPGGVATT